ncbi:helix-turn-helix domain-containing protein [Streptomyces sp. NPDC026672]
MVLERAAGAVRAVLDRTRGRAPLPSSDDPALIETLLDATAPPPTRLYAARRLGLDTTDTTLRFRAVAPAEGPPAIVPDDGTATSGHPARRPGRAVAAASTHADRPGDRSGGTAEHGDRPVTPGTAGRTGDHPGGERSPAPRSSRRTVDQPGATANRAERSPGWAGEGRAGADGHPHSRIGADTRRTGVGPAVAVLDLPRSWDAARVALRFTADGGAQDPGPRVVHADELGGLARLAELVVPGAEPPADVLAVEAAAADAPWMLRTLHAVACTASLRAAAAEVTVHHSTLQDRLAHAEHLLGWSVRTPQGRFRLQLALTMRQLTRGT